MQPIKSAFVPKPFRVRPSIRVFEPEPSSIIYTSLCLQTDLVLKIPKHLPIFPPLSSFLIRNVLGAHVFGMQPLTDKVNFVWYLVPVLRDLSISQAALILSSSNPWEKYGEHELHFKDAGFRGLNPEGIPVDQKYRDEVWTNAKIARWSGVTSVPLGVYKNKAGKYIPIFSGSSTEQIEEVIFGKPK